MVGLFRVLLVSVLFVTGAGVSLAQQTLDVTFRFLPDLTHPPIEPVYRAFLPGDFNNWGPNNNGHIPLGSPSQMDYVEDLDEYRYTIALNVGQSYQYKVYYHLNDSGSQWPNPWPSDPLNPNGFDNSVITVTDPMAFQPAREESGFGVTYAVSASLFGSSDFTSISFRINNDPEQDGLAHFDAETGLFRYELPETLPSPIFFRITATDANGNTVSAQTGLVPPIVVDMPRPDGLRNGITYVNDTTVRFSLFAPNKNFVHLIGDFNNWLPSEDYVLYRDQVSSNEVWWWFELDGLTPGQEYLFQYLVDGDLRIADPHSELILDPSHDQHIPPSTYPNLIPYPTGQTSGIVGVIHPGRPAYEWQSTDYVRPDMQDLVLYELLVRDFIGARNYQTLRDTLDYLERLGVNAISLMPVQEFDGNLSWGYNPVFHAALDKAYGTRRAFKEFIDEAHSRGIAVIIDVVYNHVHDRSPIVQLYGANPGNPFLNIPASHPYNVFLQMNHDHPFVHEYIDIANQRWLTEYRIDGFRFDLTKGFMTSGPVDGYNAQRIVNLKRVADGMWAVDDSAYVILEHFAANNEEQELAQYRREEGRPGMSLWQNMNRAYSQSAMGYLNDSGNSSNLNTSYPPNRNMPLDGLITYMESHDEQWLMYRNRAYGPTSGWYNVRDLTVALERQKLVGTFFFTIPGPRMIWQFGELGYGWGINGEECLKPGDGSDGECPPFAPGRTSEKPLPWTSPRQYHLDTDRQNLYKTWSALIHLRRSHPLFTSPDTDVTMRVGQNIAGRQIGLELDGEYVVIIGNFGLEPMNVNPDFHVTGTWYDFFNDEEINVTNTNEPIMLRAGEARIYSTIDFPSPESGIYVVSNEDGVSGGTDFSLSAPFPNPTMTSSSVSFSLSTPAHVTLEVFDLLGRRVTSLTDDVHSAGEHTVRFSTTNLSSGSYIIRLLSENNVATTRLIVIR